MRSQFESNGAGYDDAYDDEAYDDEAFDDEAAPLPRLFRVPRFGAIGSSGYRGSATINTPAGQASVDLPSDLVSKREFKALESRVLANNRAIAGAARALGNLTVNIKRNAVADKKRFDGFQRSQMFTALLPPKLTEITVDEATRGGAVIGDEASLNPSEGSPVTYEVRSTKSDLLTTLLPMIASGGMGGGTGGGSDMNMMLPMILILGDKDKGSSGKDDNSTLLLVMMMMMMNK